MSLDWSTLAFQTVNVAVLIWLLSRLFWRPLAQAIADRRAETEDVMKEAEASRAEAEKLRAELAASREGIAAERQAALEKAAEDAGAERDRILAAAQDAAKQAEAAARTRIAKMEREAQAGLNARAADLAAEMAARLGREIDGPALRAACLDGLADRLAALPEADREALRANGGVTVATPTPLPEDERITVGDRLTRALGGSAALSFRADPSLVAGIALEGPHLTVSNSWRDGLARMRAEIDRHG